MFHPKDGIVKDNKYILLICEEMILYKTLTELYNDLIECEIKHGTYKIYKCEEIS